MKTNWEVKRLGEIIQKTENVNPSQKPENEFIYVDVSSVDNRTFSIIETTLIKGKDAPSRARKLIKTNDIIFATVRPTLKRIAVVPSELNCQICSTGYFVLRAKGVIDYKFIFYFLQSEKFDEAMQKLQKGASYPAVTDSEVRDQIISYPKSLPEQQRIVAILDEAFAAIDQAKANAQRNLQNARELFDSYLQSVFANPGEGWEVCKIEDHIKFIDYRGRTPEKTSTGMRLITAKNVKLGYLQRAPEEFMNPEMYGSWMTRGIPKIGDVLFTTEAPLANVAQLDTDEKVAFAQRIIILQPQAKKLNSTFLKYLLLSSPIRKKILDQGTGATVQGIKASLLKKIEIYFPTTIIEQETIVSKLEAISAETKKLEAIYQQKLIDLDELKRSILQKAFRGELSKTQGDALCVC